MKIIATGDWHLGNFFHGIDRLPEHRHFLSWLIDRIEDMQADALLVAGDVFDNGNPSAAAQEAYYSFLAEASRRCPGLSIIVTAGNHDSPGRLDAPRPVLGQLNTQVRGRVERRWVDGSWEVNCDDLLIPVDGADGTRIVVAAVPYLRADVVGSADYSQGVSDFIGRICTRAAQLYPDRRLFVMAHMYARGAEIADRDASERILIGGQEQVAVGRWDCKPVYMTCGHIHKRQPIAGTDWARYPGSVLPMSFAEKDYTHGVDLVTLTQDTPPTVEQLVYPLQHRLISLQPDEQSMSMAKLRKLIARSLPPRTAPDAPLSDSCAYVELRVSFDKIGNDQIKELEDAVGACDAVLCKIQKLMPQVEVRALTDQTQFASIDDVLSRDPMLMLKECFKLKHPDKELSENQQKMLSDILNDLSADTQP